MIITFEEPLFYFFQSRYRKYDYTHLKLDTTNFVNFKTLNIYSVRIKIRLSLDDSTVFPNLGAAPS